MGKTQAAPALVFPERALLTARACKIKKAHLKVAQLKQNHIAKQARLRALNVISIQPETGDGDVDAQGLVAHFELPHHSHRILELQGDDSTTVGPKEDLDWLGTEMQEH